LGVKRMRRIVAGCGAAAGERCHEDTIGAMNVADLNGVE
jgi:hypothetical protein